MFQQIAYYPIFGLPLIMYGGILTLLCLLSTAIIGYLNKRGIFVISMKWHFRLSFITVLLALIHGTLGILSRFF